MGDMAEKFRNLQHEDFTDQNEFERRSKILQKAQIDQFNESVSRRAVLRYLTLIVDFSGASMKQDLRPNRAIVIKDTL